MLITNIRIRRLEDSETKMRGVASINLDDMVAIHEIKVLEAEGKFFLAMPSKQTKVGTFKDTVHPINANVREAFETLIIGGYKKAQKEGYSKIELIYIENGKKDLREQNVEDFSVQGISGGSVPASTGISSTLVKQVSSKNEIDDSLLKWLES